MTDVPYDGLLVVSFGGPEGPDDVMPFLENVLRGKPVPRERMLEVAEHYYHFGGVSPINDQNRALIASLQIALQSANIDLPIFWGNRNWQPTLTEALTQMRDAGVKRSLAFFTSMFSSYSGCRQYRENLAAAATEVGPGAPIVEKIRFGFNHPLFIETMADRVTTAIRGLPSELQQDAPLLFTAHSIPHSMAEGCNYELQLRETAQLIADVVGKPQWELVYQSRSGPPQQPWLEPDVVARVEQLHAEKQIGAVIVAPIGFISDHMEVLFDLDYELAEKCKHLGVALARAGTAGTHPLFVEMIVQLIRERLDPQTGRQAVGKLGAWHDVCPTNCCLYTPAGRPAAAR
jgi:protoporphyrin/coproporphyrin ferrochelatase